MFLAGSYFNSSLQYYCNVSNLARNQSIVVAATMLSEIQLKCVLVWPFEEAVSLVQIYRKNAIIAGVHFFNFKGALCVSKNN